MANTVQIMGLGGSLRAASTSRTALEVALQAGYQAVHAGRQLSPGADVAGGSGFVGMTAHRGRRPGRAAAPWHPRRYPAAAR